MKNKFLVKNITDLKAIDAAIDHYSKNLKELHNHKDKILQQHHYPILKEKYEGKFFVIENGFGGDSPKWKVYQKVLPFSPKDVYMIGKDQSVPTARVRVFKFQMIPDSNGRVASFCIDEEEKTFIHSLGKEISYNAFVKAWNEMIDAISASW